MSSSKPISISRSIPWWLWVNILSLDAPIVALLWQAALAHCNRVRLEPACYWSLGLAVWFIYMLDRTIDGFGKTSGAPLTARHEFYRRHRKIFALFVLPLVLLALMYEVLFELSEGLMWRGVTLAGIVGLYLLHYAVRGKHRLYNLLNMAACVAGIYLLALSPVSASFRVIYALVLGALLVLSLSRIIRGGMMLVPKELLCGYLFATGCSLSISFYNQAAEASPFIAIETMMLALLCSLNCIAIACYEREYDKIHDPHAITQITPFIVRAYPPFLAVLGFVALWLLFQKRFTEFALAILVSTMLLGALHLLAKRISTELARVLADAALITPVVILMMK